MLNILKDIGITILSIVIVGIIAYVSMFLVLELNSVGIFLSIILISIYIFLLCYFYKRLFSKRLFIGFEFVTSIFWISMFVLVNHMSSIGYWSNELFGGLIEYLICLFAIIISAITFLVTTIILCIKRKIQKH